MCECVCYCVYFYYVNKLYVHVCVLERAKHSFFALPNPLSCSVMNKICLNQNYCWRKTVKGDAVDYLTLSSKDFALG